MNETRNRNNPRSIMGGTPVTGSAWEDYTNALNETQAWKENFDGPTLYRLINDPKGDRGMVERLLRPLEHLRRGAQKTDGQYPYRWELGPEIEMPSLLGSRRLALLATAQARIWTESGRGRDAADLLLDLSVFARDLATNGPLLTELIGLNSYVYTFDELRHLVQSRKLSSKDLADLAKKLETVDREFPGIAPTLSNETLFNGIAILNMSSLAPSFQEWWDTAKEEGSWRYGFSSRQMLIEAFEQGDGFAQRAQNLDQMNFTAANKEAQAISAEIEALGNPRFFMASVPKVLQNHREARARLRVLRAATIFLSSGELPAIDDPFGDKLFYSQEGNNFKIWSVGKNGENQNGTADDVVVEISR